MNDTDNTITEPNADEPAEATGAAETVEHEALDTTGEDARATGEDARATDEDAGSTGEDAGSTGEDAGSTGEGVEPGGDEGQGDAPATARPSRRASRSRRATRPASAPDPHEAASQGGLDVLAEFAGASAPAERAGAGGPGSAAGLNQIVFAAPGQRIPTQDEAAAAGDVRGHEAGGEAALLSETASEQASREQASREQASSEQAPREQAPSEQAPSELASEDATITAPAAPRLPVTALLFQAPELTPAQRRRRAQSPAGPPTGPVGSGAGQGDDAGPEPPPRDATAPAEADDEATQEEPESGAGGQRRRRRRGGRGRRSRPSGAGGPESEDDETEDEREDEDKPGGALDDTVAQTTRDAGRESRTTRRGRRGTPSDGEGKSDEQAGPAPEEASAGEDEESAGTSRRRRRRRRGTRGGEAAEGIPPESRADEVTALKGSTRLEAKRQRRREGRDAGRRRTVVTEAEFLARRESVERAMVVRERDGRTQIAVLEDGVLVEHFVARRTQTSMVGNVYLGRVQNVLPSMEAAFVDLGKGRNAVLYAGEVNWDAAGMEGQPRRIEQALSSGDAVMVQVTKDPIGHKGARLTSQITLAGRYLVLVPSGAMTGISRKLPDTERARLKKLLREIVPEGAGVIVRTAAEGASEEELRLDVARLQVQWAEIERKAKSASAPSLLHGEPDLAIRVVRDVFNEDFGSVTISGDEAWDAIAGYIESVAPDLAPRLHRWTSEQDVFAASRIDEQLAKALDRKVWLPSGGSLVIDRTEAMTVIDVNTGKFTGSGGTLEETVTKNNLEAAEEIVRQLRLRDIGGIIVVDFIDMVLESNRDLVLRRLVECLGRDRTRHQVAEVTSLGLVQMTRKRVGQGLLEAFSEPCEVCNGRGYVVQSEPVERAVRGAPEPEAEETTRPGSRRRGRRGSDGGAGSSSGTPRPNASGVEELAAREAVKATLATIAAAAAHAHEGEGHPPAGEGEGHPPAGEGEGHQDPEEGEGHAPPHADRASSDEGQVAPREQGDTGGDGSTPSPDGVETHAYEASLPGVSAGVADAADVDGDVVAAEPPEQVIEDVVTDEEQPA